MEMAERQSIQELLRFRIAVREDAAPKGLVPSAIFTAMSLILDSAKKCIFSSRRQHMENNTSLRAYTHEKMVHQGEVWQGGFTP